MAENDDLLAAIEAIHAAGLDPEHWPRALGAAADLCGGIASTLEVLDKATHRHLEFHAFGVPAQHELAYFDHYLALNPRVPHGLRERTGEVSCDYKYFVDESGLAREPFYAEFLPRIGFRYFVSGVLRQTHQEFAAVAVQRSPAQGHVSTPEIALMQRLVPHFRQALDVTTRLKRAASTGRSLEGALDWLVDGVALLARDGAVLYANEALQDIVRGDDGIGIKKGAFAVGSLEARARFARALAAVIRLRDGDPDKAAPHDFPVARSSTAPPYLVSVRPLARAAGDAQPRGRAVAMVFVRDTLRQDTAGVRLLAEMFGLTPAEAGLARAIQAGLPLDQYALQRAVTLNTVYTHLRRIKEKTGCKRMSELIRKLNDLQVPLRQE
jgi:DNA-binding CsgD family transcriptional regulator/PAS domain-containing protein